MQAMAKINAVLGLMLLTTLFVGSATARQGLGIQQFEPGRYSMTSDRNQTVRIQFASPIAPQSVGRNDMTVRGEQTGRYNGTISVNGNEVTFTPETAFKEGELLTVYVSDAIQSTTGQTLGRGYTWQFNVRPEFGSGEFDWSLDADSYSPRVLSVGAERGPVATYAGDLNNDAFPDVVVVNRLESSIQVFRNTLRTDFPLEQETEIVAGEGPTHIAGGDLDNDGFLDLVISNQLDNTLTILVNQGSFGFDVINLPVGPRPIQSAVVDVDNDGDLDIITALFGSDEVVVLENNGQAIFSQRALLNTGLSPVSLAVADLDLDGRQDFAVAVSGSSELEYWRNIGGGNFARQVTLALNATPLQIRAGNIITGTAQPDVVVAFDDQRSVGVVETLPNFGLRYAFTADLDASPASSMVVAPVFVDRPLLELIVTHFASGNFSVLMNRDTDPFETSGAVLGSSPPTLETPMGLTALDIDRDGDVDFVLSNLNEDELWVYLNRGGRTDVAQGVSVSIPPINFGSVAVCQSREETVYYKNDGLVPVLVESGFIDSQVSSPIGLFELSIDPSLPVDLALGDSLALTVLFTPQAAESYNGQFTTVLLLDVDGQRFEALGEINGEGVEIELVANDLFLGEVVETRTGQGTLVIRNDGNTAARITDMTPTGTVFSILTPTPVTVPPGGQAEIAVEFTPDRTGDFNEIVVIATDDPCSSPISVNLTGIGTELLPDAIAIELAGVSVDALRPIVTRTYEYRATMEVADKLWSSPIRTQILVDDVVRIDTTLEVNALDTPLSLDFSLAFDELGSKDIKFVVDPANAVLESDEINNDAALTVVVDRNDELVYRPNPFTPNQDGFNDTVQFQVAEMALSEPRLEIFSMDGVPLRVVDTVEGNVLDWNGLSDLGQAQPAGVYVFVLKDGSAVIGSGTLTLAR